MNYYHLRKSQPSAYIVMEQMGSMAQPEDHQYPMVWLLKNLLFALIYPTQSVSEYYDGLMSDLKVYSSFNVDELIDLADVLREG